MNQSFAQERRAPISDDEIEVLTRGPVHEAFAETVVFDPEPGLIIQKTPPAPIEELPPEYKPEGDEISWIPGYWAWDDDRDDFLWVSGIWRALPPNRQWVPGYWARSGRGVQWTSGYWADANLEEIEYLPEPPATVEAGPNTPAPADDHTWMPGCWIWQQNRYAWRPGYWAPGQADWNWVPARYVWTPRGYVYVDGYYDYNVDRRGVLYAPVYFRSNVYTQHGYSYSPVTVINPSVFMNHLFLRPNYGHYYFGDYYSATYATRGFTPWFSYHTTYSGYDPFYAQQRWQHRADQQWSQHLQSEYSRRFDNEQARPPRTWKSQRERLSTDTADVDNSFRVGATLEELIQGKSLSRRVQPLAPEARQQIGRRGQEIRTANELRQQLESEATERRVAPPGQPSAPIRVRLPRTTIVGLPIDKLEPGRGPPKVIDVPRPDPRIEPKPRPPRGGRGNEGRGGGGGGDDRS
ncbi:MAG TPA: hypothetical protein PKD54_01725 [Pirellulaceae bacterium]|nr:hypothetical protein [Pirellulaceae bacterium]